MATRAERDYWWQSTGNRDLALLLRWVWNPIGLGALDEYASYVPTVARILEETHEADLPLVERCEDPEVQLERNNLWAEAVQRLASTLSEIRTRTIGLEPDPSEDERTAETLLDWHEQSMLELDKG